MWISWSVGRAVGGWCCARERFPEGEDSQKGEFGVTDGGGTGKQASRRARASGATGDSGGRRSAGRWILAGCDSHVRGMQVISWHVSIDASSHGKMIIKGEMIIKKLLCIHTSRTHAPPLSPSSHYRRPRQPPPSSCSSSCSCSTHASLPRADHIITFQTVVGWAPAASVSKTGLYSSVF